MAVADAGLDDRHGRLVDDGPDEAGPAARDEYVDEPTGAHEVLRRLMTRAGNELDAVPWHPRRLRGGCEHVDERDVGRAGRRRPAQQRGIAALEADPGGVDGDVGACLVDDPDDAERDPHLADLEPVGERVAAEHLTDRVGQCGDVAQAGGHRCDASSGEAEPVDEPLADPVGAGSGDVVAVRLEHYGRRRIERVGHRAQRRVLRRPRHRREHVGGGPRALGYRAKLHCFVRHAPKRTAPCDSERPPAADRADRGEDRSGPLAVDLLVEHLEPDDLPRRQ